MSEFLSVYTTFPSREIFLSSGFIFSSYLTKDIVNNSKSIATGLAVLQPIKEGYLEVAKYIANQDKNFNSDTYYKDYADAYHITYIKHILRHQRLTAPFQTLQLNELKKQPSKRFFDEINKISGLYVGFTLRSGSLNYKTIDRFLLRLNQSGKITVYVNGNLQQKFGYVSVLEQSHIQFKFSDNIQNTTNSQFTMTLIVDPITVSSFDNLRLIGIISGIETSIKQPSSGRIILIKISEKTKTSVEYESYMRSQVREWIENITPVSSSINNGIKFQLDNLYKPIWLELSKSEKYNKLFENESRYYLSNFFDPRNEFDFGETNILLKKWLKREDSESKLEDKILKIYILSNGFHNYKIDSDLCIYEYTGKFISSSEVILKLDLHSNQTLTCTYKYNKTYDFLNINGVDTEANSFDANIEFKNVLKEYSFGIVNIRMPNRGVFYSSKAICFLEKYNDKTLFSSNTKIVKVVKYGLDSNEIKDILPFLSGQLNRLIVLPKKEDRTGNIFRLDNNKLVWIYAAKQAILENKKEIANQFLFQAKLHGYKDENGINEIQEQIDKM